MAKLAKHAGGRSSVVSIKTAAASNNGNVSDGKKRKAEMDGAGMGAGGEKKKTRRGTGKKQKS